MYDRPVKRKYCKRNTLQKRVGNRVITQAEEETIIKQYLDKKDISMTEPFIRTQIIAIKKMAKRYLVLSRNTTSYFDLVGAGVLSAISALQNYIPGMSGHFFAYAEPSIKKAMIKEAHRFNRTKVSRNLWKMFGSIKTERCTNCMRRCMY
jgi:DNA-directed RNA polymerase specialized sigma subunit